MSRAYSVKEIFATLQGEGARAGEKSVFVRFVGCNLWSGEPAHRDRGKGPCARWCDTDFRKGERHDLHALVAAMNVSWGAGGGKKWCVLTGGEPSLQIDQDIVDALHSDGWMIAVETNGTIANDAVRNCDHICLSPKRGTAWRTLGDAHEIKVILPGALTEAEGWSDGDLLEVEAFAHTLPTKPRLFVQPQDPLVAQNFVEETFLKRNTQFGADEAGHVETIYRAHVTRCLAWIMSHSQWRLSAQLHKYIGIS